jgi:hypothetical protein
MTPLRKMTVEEKTIYPHQIHAGDELYCGTVGSGRRWYKVERVRTVTRTTYVKLFDIAWPLDIQHWELATVRRPGRSYLAAGESV